MTDIENVFDLKNLRRAYRWMMSNTDSQYKSYFRDSYEAFAIASDTHLKWIRQEGLKERYQVTHASKVLVPKLSGILRPITLLTVEDQIVYQACVNLIADALKRKTGRRYGKRVFAHLYAGKSSPFFYMQWQSSYRKFSAKIRDAFDNGYKFVADFDLTSFYDSIDHHVLTHFLNELAIDKDTIALLMECLKHWTSTTWTVGPRNIYHGHGIPQGPLPSGMLSEAVLLHLDEAGEQGSRTIYLRYVDDIKILAKTEGELRRKLIKLDMAAKEIGLFPQTSKINIHKITDPNDEVKSVSRPPERSIKPKVDHPKLAARILELSRNSTVKTEDATRFKFLLAHAQPTYKLNARLMGVLRKHPEHAPSICSYIERYAVIPAKMAADIVNYLCDGPELYHSVNGALLSASHGRVTGTDGDTLAKFSAARLVRPRRGSLPVQPTYKDALVAWGLSMRTLTYAEYEGLLFGEPDWWVQKRMLRQLNPLLFGAATYADLINRSLRAKNGEASRIAASRLLQESIKLTKPYGDVEVTAKQTLRATGIIRSAGQPDSRISQILAYILKRSENAYQWKALFGTSHKHAELMAIILKRNFESNIDAFLVQLDSYCDLMTEKIWAMQKPGKTYPHYGHAIKDTVLGTALHDTMSAFLTLHNLRLQSSTAHPRTTKTGKPTRRLKHRDFYAIRPALIKALDEIERTIKP
jgi:retron-type reverse transcriptase